MAVLLRRSYLFVGDTRRDHDAHGPNFVTHMLRVNAALGLRISVYHSFIDEVKNYKVHVWQCQGKCRSWAPFYGKVSRASNRKPGPADRWSALLTALPKPSTAAAVVPVAHLRSRCSGCHCCRYAQHQHNCGGYFVKIAGPSAEELEAARKEKAKQKRAEKSTEKKAKDKREAKSKDRKAGLKQTDVRTALTPVKKRPAGDDDEEEEEKKDDGEDKPVKAPRKRRMKGVKGRGHVLGTGDEQKDGSSKRKRKRKAKEVPVVPLSDDDPDDEDYELPRSKKTADNVDKPARVSTVPASIQATVISTPRPSSTPSSTASAGAVPSSSSSPFPAPRGGTADVAVARGGTNIFALMQARGQGAKVASLLQKAKGTDGV